MTDPTVPARKVPKHLIDPTKPRPRQAPEERRQDEARLNHVKEWVMSVLVVTTMFHLAVGLILAAIFTDSDRVDARIGLNVIAAILLVAGVAGARVIHHKNPLSTWLLLGTVPTIVGLVITFR